MRPRAAIGRFLIRSGRFIQSLAVMVMRPRDLQESTRRTYGRPEIVAGWADAALVEAGLSEEEKELLDKVPFRQGRALVLGVGGGREAVALARQGFEVTGLDFVPALVEKARENARARGFAIEGLVQDFARLDVPAASFDLVCLLGAAYSALPTKKRRWAMLERVREALRPEGWFLCQFVFDCEDEFAPRWEFLRRAFSKLTLGNLSYEKGDRLAPDGEFLHVFASEAELRAEFEPSGFEVVSLVLPAASGRGGAALKKPG
jgi:ubiquinone/menaquinone biosynthesis C-methylase UbiE